MTQEELEHLLHARAGPRGPLNVFQFTESTETVDLPPDPAAITQGTRKVQVPVRTWTDPGTGRVVRVQANPDGTYTKLFDGIDEKAKGEPATTPAQVAAAAGASDRKPVEGKPGIYQVSTKTQRPDGGTDTETHYEDEGGNRVPTPTTTQAGRSEKPVQINGKTYTQITEVGDANGVKKERTYLIDPTTGQEVQAPAPAPEMVNLPPTQKWAVRYDAATGKYITEKNPNYKPPSRIEKDQETGQYIEITEDDDGKLVVRPISGQTRIKPADLPVLQAKYGEIAQGLGALAQDLNSRYARGEITEKQKNDAFTAAHQQAQTQVSEINQILDTSKTIWSGELTQRGQSLGETQSRRGFAQNIFDRSVATGLAVGESAGPGHGKAIAAGVGALMRMGQRYAEGMGGFKESPEVALPPALQQARGIGIPGYEGAPAGPAGGVPAPGGSLPPGGPPAPPGPPATGGPLGAAPQLSSPSGTTSPPIFRPPPPVDGAMSPQSAMPGQNPMLASMGSALQAGQAFGGSPVAAGGLGVYDPTQDVQGMVGDGADPTWAEAVRRAAAEVTQPGYAWSRFTQPASRFG